jgi:Tfp pilus assembly protein PilZ
MPDMLTIDFFIQSQAELNLSYMPFINGVGLFIPTAQSFSLGDKLLINLKLPTQTTSRPIEGKVVWITPKNALYQVYSGIGVQVTSNDLKDVHDEIKAGLDNKMEVGGYIFGISKDER